MLIVLVQLGGLGTMTVGTFFLVLIGRRLSLANEFAVMNAYGAKGVRGWRGLVLWVVLSTSAVELVGMCMLHAGSVVASTRSCRSATRAFRSTPVRSRSSSATRSRS